MACRTCIGCRETAASAHLLRLVRDAAGALRPDPLAVVPGRGAWVHPRPSCVGQAARARILSRAFRAETRVEPSELLAAAQAATAETTAVLHERWRRGGCVPGPLERRLRALEAAAEKLATGTRA
jgi:predicted RNA-binding protein YlxR (DUF448 family)